MPWLKIIRAFFIVSKWSKGALKDGKVTLKEALDLAFKLSDLLGLPAKFSHYDNIPLPGDKNYQTQKTTEEK
ncbi:hypothetical protein LCGC14_0823730 [marine sediment metagenome]|uniref:Uncharacterized protein n=1 Tax=marine sediment metagenome TaxID=412755 RepID=A0A0F9PI04_9ZZZZ